MRIREQAVDKSCIEGRSWLGHRIFRRFVGCYLPGNRGWAWRFGGHLWKGESLVLIPLSDIRALSSYQFISAACIHLVLITALFISIALPIHHVSAHLMPCLTFTSNHVIIILGLHHSLHMRSFQSSSVSQTLRPRPFDSPASPKRMVHSLHLQLPFMIISFNHLDILGAAPWTLVTCTDTIHSRNYPV